MISIKPNYSRGRMTTSPIYLMSGKRGFVNDRGGAAFETVRCEIFYAVFGGKVTSKFPRNLHIVTDGLRYFGVNEIDSISRGYSETTEIAFEALVVKYEEDPRWERLS